LSDWLQTALDMISGIGIGTEPGLFPMEQRGSFRGLGGGGGIRAEARRGYTDHHGVWHEKPHRRRRRRVLSASDRADIAFIAATISKTAAGAFASVVAAR